MATNGPQFNRIEYLDPKAIPYVTYGLITISSLVFLYEILLAGAEFSANSQELTGFFHRWGFISSHLTTHIFSGYSPQQHHTIGSYSFLPGIITIFSSMFIHAGWMHFAGNILFLWVLGDNVEGRLGHLKFFAFYFLAGVSGTLLHSVFNLDSGSPLIGASGAIYGIAGAYVVMFTRNIVPIIIWFIFPNIQGLGFSDSVAGNISYLAHAGGFVFGLVATVYFSLVTRTPIFFTRPRGDD